MKSKTTKGSKRTKNNLKGGSSVKKRIIWFAVAVLLIAIGVMAVNVGGLKNLAQNLFNAGESFNFGDNENADGISTISMETSGFDESDPGSWHLDKSAKWTDIDKAQITFDVKSNNKNIRRRK